MSFSQPMGFYPLLMGKAENGLRLAPEQLDKVFLCADARELGASPMLNSNRK